LPGKGSECAGVSAVFVASLSFTAAEGDFGMTSSSSNSSKGRTRGRISASETMARATPTRQATNVPVLAKAAPPDD
jgi:hypothetical protein